MRFICVLFMVYCFGCSNQAHQPPKNENSVFSDDEKKIIHTYFKTDTTVKSIEPVKIQTH